MRKIIFLVICAAIFLLLFLFSIKNLDHVTLNFFNLTWEVSLIILIFVVFALGCFVGALAMIPLVWSQRRKGKKALKQAQEASSEVSALIKAN